MNPVYRDETDGKWYFWDETWANRLGPYETKEAATSACQDYAIFLDGGGCDPNTHGQKS